MEDSTVSAADIARLAGVGRAAVSNWRRRHPDFPQPVGGTPASPLFGLHDVETWLRGQRKLETLPPEELLWQRVRAQAVDDLRIGEVVVAVGEALLGRGPARDDASRAAVALAETRGAQQTFAFLVDRYLEVNARRIATTPPDLAGLMVDLAGDFDAVLDPACGVGGLLLAARARSATARLLGQDTDETAARIAELRAALPPGDVRHGDSLRADAFPGVAVDVVLCDPPFHERSWGHEELTTDPRWTYGLPPRMEPELAWVQHCLAHLAPGGLAILVMPPVAAARRSGRRIRAQLLRSGALSGVIAYSAAHHLWLLGPPSGDTPSSVLMIEDTDPAAIAETWHAHAADPDHDRPGVSRAVPVIDLLDEEVDLTPGRHLSSAGPGSTAERLPQTRDRLAAELGRLGGLVPDVSVSSGGETPLQVTSVAELARTGALEIHQAPARGEVADGGAAGEPLLTTEDIIQGRQPSGRVLPDDARWIVTEAGDVVVAVVARHFAARVVETGGALLGPQLTLLRVAPDRLDPYFLAGVLHSSANVRSATVLSTGGGRADVRRVSVPRLTLERQRAYGRAFRRMTDFQTALRFSSALAGELAQLLADGMAAGLVTTGETGLVSPDEN